MHEFSEKVNRSWPNFNFVFFVMNENVQRHFWNLGNDINKTQFMNVFAPPLPHTQLLE